MHGSQAQWQWGLQPRTLVRSCSHTLSCQVGLMGSLRIRLHLQLCVDIFRCYVAVKDRLAEPVLTFAILEVVLLLALLRQPWSARIKRCY